MMHLVLPAICVITRARGAQGSAERLRLLTRLREAAEAGATIIQIRERQMADRELLPFVNEVVEHTTGTGAVVLINDRPDIAAVSRAAGVHLKSNAAPASAVRTVLPAGALVGRSVHGAAEARRVESDGGCDYLLFGTVFPTGSKPAGHPVAGVDALAAVCRAVKLPVFAIGGIHPRNADRAMAAGAAGVAAMALFAEAPDPAAAARELRHSLTLSSRNV